MCNWAYYVFNSYNCTFNSRNFFKVNWNRNSKILKMIELSSILITFLNNAHEAFKIFY